MNSGHAEVHSLVIAGYGVPHVWPELLHPQPGFGFRRRGVDRFEVGSDWAPVLLGRVAERVGRSDG